MTSSEPEYTTLRSQVVAKAALLIVVVGATGIGLLTERQRRFEAAHSMTVAHRKADELEREIRKLRAEIADRLTPSRIDARIDSLQETSNERFDPIVWSNGAVREPTE